MDTNEIELSFFANIFKRRVPQILGIYLADKRNFLLEDERMRG